MSGIGIEQRPQPRFKPYPAYKDSGVEWLGEIPADWEVRRLKTLISEPITDGPHETPAFLPEGIPFLSVDGIQEGELVFDGCRYISEVAHKEYRKKCAPRRDDILLGKAASTGKIARVKADLEFSVWSPLALIRPDPAESRSDFLEYALKSVATQAQIDVLCTTNTQKNISMRDIPILVVCVAPLPQQRAIAAFLDRETARIDALLAKKERLIELLQEKRTALITRAVTKGLDPDVPMKDSGVEWLGDVAGHWEVKRIKFIAQVGNGSTPNRDNAEYWDGEYPWLNSGVVNLAEVTVGSDFVTDLALGECHLPRIHPPAVLVGITGEGRTRGMATVLRIEATINQHLVFIRPTRALSDAEYIRYVLHAAYQFLRDESGGGGSTKGALTCDQLGNVLIPFPPEREQRAIATFLDRETARIDVLVAKVREAIEHLKELRTALISAAVTGKIDVRGEVAGGASR